MTDQLTAAAILRGGPADEFVAREDFPPLTHYIDGEFVPSYSDEVFTLVNPATGENLVSVPNGTADDTDAAIAAAKAALPAWRRTTPKTRAELLLKIADRIEASSGLFKRLEALNTGKPHPVADDDVSSTVDVFRFAAGAARAFSEVGSAEYVEGHTSILVREPIGVVGAVVPWNYPLLMGAWKIAPILAAGNTLVVKPSEQTPLSLLKLVEVVGDLIPAGVLNVVLGTGPVVGERLSTSPDVDLVALTGSVRSGKAVATAAAGSLKRVHLELGGKAPVVILPDADLALAAEGVRTAGYWNAGQECGAGTRVLVHESVADRFTSLLADQVRTLKVGEPWAGDDVEIGPMISEAHFGRVTAFLERAIADGAVPVVGGAPLPGPGFFIAPTVLADVAPRSEASQEEIFGPVVTIETFADTAEAIERANEVPYGLAASVWTRDASDAIELPKQLDFGTVWVNAHLVIANEAPWGGFKGSGYGRDLSAYALQDYSRTKHVQINHSR
ncbi:aldehyde dehydrogenase family protein [Microbacterium sp. B2969]|uniref:Aldehyde dehydrogenase family protein n=1 Tax=Microbacterium alkaliflavum TaxID=3248839 RepID=A0ABW7QED8_9MICO